MKRQKKYYCGDHEGRGSFMILSKRPVSMQTNASALSICNKCFGRNLALAAAIDQGCAFVFEQSGF